MTTVTIRSAARNGAGGTTFEADVTQAGTVIMPSATITPARADGAIRRSGELSWLRLSGPILDGHPNDWASWAWDDVSADPQRDLSCAPESIAALAALVLEATKQLDD